MEPERPDQVCNNDNISKGCKMIQTVCKCQKKLNAQFSEKDKLYFFYCSDCKLGGKGKTEKSALTEFEKALAQTGQVALTKKENFLPWINQHETEFINHGAAYLDRPALRRLIKKNTDYIMKADLKNAWNTPEGVQSIAAALSEAVSLGAVFPETGSLVPFKDVVEFIPSVHVYKSALTTGQNPICKNIVIDCIYENDIYEAGTVNGQFHYELKKVSLPRGDVIGVVVIAEKSDGKTIGDIYDIDRLMKKAEQHSTSYKYYLKDMRDLLKAQSEGKNYIDKWGKKYYAEDITNPYVNADRPEMLKKVAGKSFLTPLFKEKMINAAVGEMEEPDAPKRKKPLEVVERSIKAFEDIVVDAEVVESDNVQNDELFD
jgi:hypothetical protein